MLTVESRAQIKLQNILYLTDFSEASKAAPIRTEQEIWGLPTNLESRGAI
jgi:hypothetical protein